MSDERKKILIFGTGDYYQRYKNWLNEYHVIALIDNNPRKQGGLLDNCRVISPEEGIGLEYDFIVILSVHDKEMREQLLSLGVDYKKIYNQNDLHLLQINRVVRPLTIYTSRSGEMHNYEAYKYNVSDKIVLFSNDLHINGASLALVHAANVLAVCRDVLVVTGEDGPCREILNNRGIDVIIDKNISVSSMDQIPWLADARLMICNTINFYRFLEKRYLDIPVIWWLHEPPFFYESLDKDILGNIPQENMQILVVSKIAQNAYQRYYPQALINILPVYVDEVEKIDRNQHKRFTFAVIGYVRPWKGQDIFIHVAQEMQDDYDDIEFLIIGDNSSHFAQKLKDAENDKIHFIGEMSPVQLNEMYEDIDVVVCPSRIESLSIVVIEAMLRGIPSIVSSSAGVAEYITDGVDGWIFTSESIDELKEKMVFAIEHKEETAQMGQRSRKIYEKHFSKEVFTERLLRIIDI